ncbi:hypothetical protein DL767_010632 [Monosporascus sp. MG133]|nr:hypothetical protein DL767_010632 [Monosporascus sp. MG133]
MTTSLASLRDHFPQNLLDKPWAGAAVAVSIIILIILFIDHLNYQKQRKRLGDIAIVGDAPYLWRRLRWTENEVNFRNVIQRGYDTFNKKFKPFAYWGQHDDFIIVVPPGVCDEVKNVGPEKLSFLQAVEDSYHFKLHTNILGRCHVDAVRQSVNKNMNQLHNIVVEQGDETIPQVLDGFAKDKEPFAAFLTIWHLVHVVAASFLIGPEFSRNPDYMKEIEDYCLNVPHFVHLYFWVPAPLRLAFWYLSPQGFRVRACIKRLKRFIVPEIRRTIDAWRNREPVGDKYTLLGAMLDLKEEIGQIKRDPNAMSKAEEKRQIDIFSDEVIFTGFDSAGPVACLVTQLLFESMHHKDLVEPLRNEITAALAANGGEWNSQAMSSLPRLESFTRETLRVDGPTLFSVTRSVIQPMQLKSGLSLRPGSIISSPAWLIHNDEDNYEKASEFNPYRFYDEKTNTNTTRATTGSNTFLAYGYGTQMCPGRYLGIRMSQILFAKILMRYDAEFEDAENGKPDNIFMPGQVLPQYQAKIVLKNRKGDTGFIIMKGTQGAGKEKANSPEKQPDADTVVSNVSNCEAEPKAQDEPPQGGFVLLMRVFTFGTGLDRTIQIFCVFAALCSGAAMPLMALVLGQLTADFTNFGSADNEQSSSEFMQAVQTNALWFVYLFIGKFTACRLVYLWSFGFTFTANRMVQTLRLTSWHLTLVMLGLVLVTLGLIGFVVGSDQKIEAGLLKRYTDCSAIAEDALGSIKTVVAFGAANKFLAKYDKILEQAEKDGKKRGPFVGLMFACQYFFMFTGWAIGFYLGTYLYRRGQISDPGRILAVFFAMLIGLGAIMALGPNMPSFIKAVAAAGDVFKILDTDAEKNGRASEPGVPEHETCDGHLELRNLSFSYQSRQDRSALSNISLDFARGTSTAIVGPSGAGKSTLISLLERWYEPTGGCILLDGHDISTVDVKWLRSQIALVQQEPQLFNASIFENIAYGLVGTKQENASYNEKMNLVEEASREAKAYDFITKLPKAFHTVVGDRGSLISGGQKQRIAIARALIGRRPILLMDEATSALDGENSKVIETLMAASQNRTTLFISHKILTAKRADRTVVLDQGKVAEQGTHEELIRADGLYKRLYDTQIQLEAGDHAVEAIEKPSIQEVSPIDEASATPDSSAQLSEIPEIRKRSLLANLWTIAIEQKRFWPIFFTGVVACIVTAQIFPVQAILLGRVLQTFQGPAEELSSDANFWSLMFFVVGLGALTSYAILGFFMTLLGVRLTKFYRLDYFRSVLHQRMEFFDRVASGALVSRLTSDPSNLHDLISVNMGLLISIFVSIISGSIIALAFSWKFALVAIFGAMPLVFAAGFVRMKLDSSLAEATAKIFEESARFASDALSAFRTVKAFTMENTVRQSYEQRLSSSIGKLYRQTAIITLFFALSESVELLAAALAFWYGGTLLRDEETTTERFFTVFIAVVVGGQAAGALFGFSSNISKAKIAANNILGVRTQVHEARANDQSTETPREKSTDVVVDFQNVSFAYPARPDVQVLKGISLKVFRGQTVGVVGSSGSGKSTLVALLERFYDTQSGSLNVFGQPVSTYHIDEYRKRLAIVPQEPTLYRGSVRENVVLGVDENQVQEGDVVEACNSANLGDFIASLPEGYDTECGGQGIGFSGGQKQRVAIARALIRNPEILLLDEPTSALDAETEQLVRQMLQDIKKRRTMILVTHRLNIVRNADIIIFMSGGEILEQGTHSELMARQGHYFRMYQSSLGGGM